MSTAINLAVGVVAALGGSATKLGRAVYRAAWSAASQLGGQARRAARRVLNAAWRARRAGQAACFVAGTLVATSTGDVPIEEIAAGDVVWSIDETGQAVLSTVAQTFMRTTDSVVTLEIVNERGQVVETLETTPEHPFLTAISNHLEWTPAGLLEPGSPVYSLASGWLHVGSATVQQGSVPVLLLTVAIVPGFSEEIFFRGMVQRTFGFGWVAITISAVTFALIHVTPAHIIGVLPLGFFLAWLGARTGSLWLCIFLHTLNNTIAIIAAKTVGMEQAAEALPLWAAPLGWLIAAPCVYAIYRATSDREATLGPAYVESVSRLKA